MTKKIKGEDDFEPVSVRLKASMHAALRDAADAQDVPKSIIIVDAIAAWLDRLSGEPQQIDLTPLGAGRAELAREFVALDARDMELALRLLRWWREPGVSFEQLVLKPGLALALRDDSMRREAELQDILPEEKP